MKVNLYDFDKTIYDGDSTVDFYLYCLNKKKSIIKYLPSQVWFSGLYLIKRIPKKIWKENFFVFLKEFQNIEELVDEFWKEHSKKLKSWYLIKDHSNDIIISASPTFLLMPISKQLKVKKLIATEVNPKNGKILSENCYGEEKVIRFKKEFPNAYVEEAYSDSYSDIPILKLAKKGYIVNKDKITPYDSINNKK